MDEQSEELHGGREYPSASRSWQRILASWPAGGDVSSNLSVSSSLDERAHDAHTILPSSAHSHAAGGHRHSAHGLHKRMLRADALSWPGWSQSWIAGLLYGGGSSSLLDLEEQEERAGLGYNASDAMVVSAQLSVLVLVLAVLLWRLAAPTGGDDQSLQEPLD